MGPAVQGPLWPPWEEPLLLQSSLHQPKLPFFLATFPLVAQAQSRPSAHLGTTCWRACRGPLPLDAPFLGAGGPHRKASLVLPAACVLLALPSALCVPWGSWPARASPLPALRSAHLTSAAVCPRIEAPWLPCPEPLPPTRCPRTSSVKVRMSAGWGHSCHVPMRTVSGERARAGGRA